MTEYRVKQDCVECLRYLVEERHRAAERISLVQDNLNLHTAGAPYETFPPTQARNTLGILWTGWSFILRTSMAAG